MPPSTGTEHILLRCPLLKGDRACGHRHLHCRPNLRGWRQGAGKHDHIQHQDWNAREMLRTPRGRRTYCLFSSKGCGVWTLVFLCLLPLLTFDQFHMRHQILIFVQSYEKLIFMQSQMGHLTFAQSHTGHPYVPLAKTYQQSTLPNH